MAAKAVAAPYNADMTPRVRLLVAAGSTALILYVALFTASVAAILGFMYWSTVAVIDRQTTATIEAEIKGLAEQYKERDLAGLVEVIRERAGDGGDSVYLLVDPVFGRLAGNLTAWPPSATAPSDWVGRDN